MANQQAITEAESIASNIEEIEYLRQISFEYVKTNRPGDLADQGEIQSLAELTLPPPNEEEAHYIVDTLRGFAKKFAGIVPEKMRERQEYFKPPLIAPTGDQILADPSVAIEALESFRPHLYFGYKEQKQYDKLIQDTRYIVESSARAVLGLGKTDPFEYQHVLRTLTSATSSAEEKLKMVEKALGHVTLPNLPIAFLTPTKTPVDPTAVAKTKGAWFEGFLAYASDLAESIAGPCRRFKNFAKDSWQSFKQRMRHTGEGLDLWKERVTDFFGRVTDAAKGTVKFIGKSIKIGAAVGAVGGVVGGVGYGVYCLARHLGLLEAGVGALAACIGGSAIAFATGYRFRAQGFHFAGQLGNFMAGPVKEGSVVAIGSVTGVVWAGILGAGVGALKLGKLCWTGSLALLNLMDKAVYWLESTKLFHSAFFRGKTGGGSGRFGTLSSQAVSYFKSFGKKAECIGEIHSLDEQFWKKLGVLNVHVIGENGSKLIELGQFLKDKESDPNTKAVVSEIRKHLYREQTLNTTKDISESEPEFNTVKICWLRTNPGPHKLLLPVGYEVKEVAFYDKKNKLLTESDSATVTECALGSALVDSPARARFICYTIQRSEKTLSNQHLDALRSLLPNLQTYQGIEGAAYSDAMSYFNLDRSEKMKLLFANQVDQKFTVVQDRFVDTFIEKSGSAAFETVSGLRMGSKDSITYFSAANFCCNGMPSVIVSGLPPDASERTFTLVTGHSQAAILTEDGVKVADLSQNADRGGDLKTKSIQPRDRYQMFKRLRGLDYKGVYNYAAEVRDGLKQKHQDLGFFQNLASAVFELRRLGSVFRGEGYETRKLERGSLQNDFDRVGQPKEARVIQALAAKISFDRTIDDARERGESSPVFQLFKDKPTLPGLTNEELALVPPDHAGIESYNPKNKVISFAAESLRNDNFSEAAKATTVDWLLVRIPDRSRVLEYCKGELDERGLDKFRFSSKTNELLALSELTTVLDKDTVSQLTPKQCRELIFGALALPHANIGVDYMSDPKTLEALVDSADLVLSLVKGAAQTKNPFNREEKEALALLAAEVGSNLAKQSINPGLSNDQRDRSAEAIKKYAQFISVVTDIGAERRVTFFFDLFLEGMNPRRQALVDFAAKVGRAELFGDNNSPQDNLYYSKALGEAVTTTFCRRRITDNDIERWKQAITFFGALGIEASQTADHARIRNHFGRELRRLHRAGEINVGYGDVNERPASYLVSKMIDYKSVDLMRLGQLFTDEEILAQGDLKRIWPDLPEEEVFDFLNKEIHVDVNRRSGKVTYRCASAKDRVEIPIDRLLCLSSDLLSNSRALTVAARYNALREDQPHWAEVAFESIRDNFPRQWKKIKLGLSASDVQAIAVSTLKSAYDGVSPQEAYQGFLAEAAMRSTPDYDAQRDRFLKNIESHPIESSKDSRYETFAVADQIFEECVGLGEKFKTLSRAAKIGALIGASFLREEEFSKDKAANPLWRRLSKLKRFRNEYSLEPASDFFGGQMQLPYRLYRLASTQVIQKNTPEASAWHTLFSPSISLNPGTWIDFSSFAEEAKNQARIFHSKFREPLQRFLYSQTGGVVVNSATGDFRGYRDYGHGDSLRQVDWKRSVKDGALAVRLKEEEESRPLRLVYDLELLVDSYEKGRCFSRQDLDTQTTRNALRELFIICNLAAQENTRVDLVLFGRSHQVTMEQVVKRGVASAQGTFDQEKFSRTLASYLNSAKEVYEAEQSIDEDKSLEPSNIFAANDIPAETGQLHIVAVSDGNRELSRGALRFLRERGVLAALRDDTRRARANRRSEA